MSALAERYPALTPAAIKANPLRRVRVELADGDWMRRFVQPGVPDGVRDFMRNAGAELGEILHCRVSVTIAVYCQIDWLWRPGADGRAHVESERRNGPDPEFDRQLRDRLIEFMELT